MNPLSEYPHLFVGNFKVAIGDSYTNLKILTYNSVRDQYHLSVIKGPVHVTQCQLIARPIEDITDEEMKQFPNLSDSSTKEMIDWYRESLKDYSGVGISSKDFLHLLEIGCYPFDNSDFGDTVIDTRTLTNA